MDLAKDFRIVELLPGFVDTYSLGTRQKLSVLLALLGNPQLIILDEAFNGLDPRSVLLLKDYLRKGVEQIGCSVLLATHSLDIVLEYSTQAGLLIDGKLQKVWSAQELQNFRASGIRALEQVMAEDPAMPS